MAAIASRSLAGVILKGLRAARARGRHGGRPRALDAKTLAVARSLHRDPSNTRDLAIVRCLHDMALRRGEVVGLDIAAFDPAGPTLAVVGKGKSDASLLTVPRQTAAALHAWLASHPDPRPAAPVFCPLDP